MPARPTHQAATEQLRGKVRLIGLETLRMTDTCGSGHGGSSFSMAEIVAAAVCKMLA